MAGTFSRGVRAGNLVDLVTPFAMTAIVAVALQRWRNAVVLDEASPVPRSSQEPAGVVDVVDRHLSNASSSDDVLRRYRALISEVRWTICAVLYFLAMGAVSGAMLVGAQGGLGLTGPLFIVASVIGGGGAAAWLTVALKRRWRSGGSDAGDSAADGATADDEAGGAKCDRPCSDAPPPAPAAEMDRSGGAGA